MVFPLTMKDCIIWTKNGAWLQTVTRMGENRMSYLGQLSLEETKHRCEVLRIPLAYLTSEEPLAFTEGWRSVARV